MLAQPLIERVDDLRDREILRAADRYGKIAPEILQHLAPRNLAVGNLVELVFEIGGEAVFDIALEETGEERGDERGRGPRE